MKYLSFVFFLILAPLVLNGQVRVVPEIGINYHPHTLVNYHSEVSVNNIDFLVGLSGYVPIKKDWFFTTRIEYIPKKKAFYMGDDNRFSPSYLGYEYTNHDLNIIFGLSRNFRKNSVLSAGLGIKHRLISEALSLDRDEPSHIEDFPNKLLPIIDLSYEYSFHNMNLRISYLKILRKERIGYWTIQEITGSNGLRFTMGYNLVKK